MMTSVRVRDETIFRSAAPAVEFSLEVPTMRVTVRELLRSRIYSEVNDYNLDQADYFKGLVQPDETESTRDGYRMGRGRVLDPQRQFEQAVRAFTQNGFMILVDDAQVDDLDHVVELGEHSVVTFLKLIPLVGG